MTWVPPEGGAAAPPPQATPADATPTSTPAAPRDTFTRTAIIVGVVGGIVAGCLIGGIGTGLAQAHRPPSPTYDPDPYVDNPGFVGLAQGEPDPATAVTPLVCDEACFDAASAESVILGDDVFEDFAGLDVAYDSWYGPESAIPAAQEHADAWENWNGTDYAPDECFVTWSETPVVEPEDAAVGEDPILAITAHETDDPYSYLNQSVRLFADTASASAYMERLAAGVDGCPHYEDADGFPLDDVTREPTIHPPDSVAAVGFVDSADGTRFYVYDLQRGNMVIRTTAYSEGGLEDTQFRQVIQKQMALLEQLQPVAGG